MTNAGKIEEATPRPWRYIANQDNTGSNEGLWSGAIISDPDNAASYHVARIWNDANSVNGSANAALIVRAVNAHPNLLSVLKQIEDFSSDPTSVSLARAAREYVGALP